MSTLSLQSLPPWNPTSCEQDVVSMREGDGSGTSGLSHLPAGSHRGSVYSATRHAAWEHGYGPDHGPALWLCVFMSPSCKLVFSFKVIFNEVSYICNVSVLNSRMFIKKVLFICPSTFTQ